MRLLVTLTTAILLTPLAPAQAPPPFNSHQVNPDHTITFRYADPGAHKVILNLEGAAKPIPMAHETDDPASLWTVTTPPLPPEIYIYRIDVDGRPQFDPNNLVTGPNLVWNSNPVTVPGASPMPWELTAIPHGALERHIYTTKSVLGLAANQSEYLVYTPPGYDPRAKTRYPVLYLLHGWSNTSDSWTGIGKANLILDTLIAQRKARPMVVVMPFGYGAMSFVQKGFDIWKDDAAINQNTTLFTQALLTEILPQVESTYNVSREPRNRAIAGLSMGGLEALSVGLNHTDQFAWVAGMSAAVHRDAFLQSLPAFGPRSRPNLRLLWIACGTEDDLIKPNRKLATELKSRGLPVTEIETPGRHVWQVWREDLVRLAPLLFQPE